MPKKTMSIITRLLPPLRPMVVKDTDIPHDIGRICSSHVERPFLYKYPIHDQCNSYIGLENITSAVRSRTLGMKPWE